MSGYSGTGSRCAEHGMLGAGSVLQHVVANGGQTQPPLFRAAMTSSTFLPSQYNYNDSIPTVRHLKHYVTKPIHSTLATRHYTITLLSPLGL